MLLTLSIAAGLAAATTQTALAFNPQPEPPGKSPRLIDNPDLRNSVTGSGSLLSKSSTRGLIVDF
jgi:hypothetical protein